MLCSPVAISQLTSVCTEAEFQLHIHLSGSRGDAGRRPLCHNVSPFPGPVNLVIFLYRHSVQLPPEQPGACGSLPPPHLPPLAAGHPEVTTVLCLVSSGCGNQPERCKINCFLMTDGSGVENKSKERIMILVIPTFFHMGKGHT